MRGHALSAGAGERGARRLARGQAGRRGGAGALAHRLGVADDALDLWRAQLQRALERIDGVVHLMDAELRIDAAMKIDDLAVRGLADAYIVHIADDTAFGRQFAERHG